MVRIRLGQVDYLNTLPVFHGLEDGILPFDGELIKGSPTAINQLFLEGRLDVASISSIEYARNIDKCMILPQLSVSAEGPVKNILLFSAVPVTELDRKRVLLSPEAETAVGLLRVLFDHYYHVDAKLAYLHASLSKMLESADAALLVGDEAIRTHLQVVQGQQPYHVIDLGEVWKQFTGEKLVSGLWVVQKDFAREYPEQVQVLCELLLQSRQHAQENMSVLLKKGRRRTGLPTEVLEDIFNTVNNELTEHHRRALLTYFDYCYKSGLIEERVRLAIWGEEGV